MPLLRYWIWHYRPANKTLQSPYLISPSGNRFLSLTLNNCFPNFVSVVWSLASEVAGGYHLAKPLHEIDVMSIISAVDESVNAMQCEGRGDCQGGTMCLTHDLWCALSNHIEQYLKNITLAQLLDMENVQSVSERQHSSTKEISIKDINTITLSNSEANPA